MTDEPPHVRSFPDKMKRYFGNIESELYKAEVACPGGSEKDCRGCDFFRSRLGCIVTQMREILGDHVEHHDIPEVQS